MTGRRKATWIIGALTVALVATGTVAARWRLGGGDHLGGLRAGDCLTYTGKDDAPYEKADCGAAGVYDKVVGSDRASNEHACWDVPGASDTLVSGDRVICLGDVDADPSTAINVAEAGDCVILPDPRTALRHDCADPQAEYVVLKRKTSVPVGEGCGDVPGSARSYAINWESQLARTQRNLGNEPSTDDVLLCLGENPTVVAAHASAAAARSQCRFLDSDEVSAAVTRGAGRKYTVTLRQDGMIGCEYQFGSAKERVSVDFTPGEKFEPGGAQVFKLDGLRAYYSPGEGDRVVGVEVAGGMFSVVVWLADTSDAFSKKVGIEVFRTARPKLG
ncbi:hypothetical protein [Actinoplanes sp. NPDC020271]|uniref:hypothetical protein n=1 Tax=Actinoplanes sp. NPDC020271 TaxID=3363896 RepID=UPI0037959331